MMKINLIKSRGGKGMHKMTPARKTALKKAQAAAAAAKKAGSGMHDRINAGIKKHGPIPFATAGRINFIAEARSTTSGLQIRFTRSKKFYNTTNLNAESIERKLREKGF